MGPERNRRGQPDVLSAAGLTPPSNHNDVILSKAMGIESALFRKTCL